MIKGKIVGTGFMNMVRLSTGEYTVCTESLIFTWDEENNAVMNHLECPLSAFTEIYRAPIACGDGELRFVADNGFEVLLDPTFIWA